MSRPYESRQKNRLAKSRPSAAALANHQRLAARNALMRRFGYDPTGGVKFVLDQALPLSGSILEIGTGKGRFLVALAPHASQLTTVDISAEEQRCARLNIRYEGVKTRIKYVLQDAAHLPWPAGTFDAVVTMNALHHLPHLDRVLEEMLRVVKPDGKLVLADLSPRGFQILEHAHRSEGHVHERHPHDFRGLKTWLHNRGWITRHRKGKLQEVIVAWTIPNRDQAMKSQGAS